MIRSYPIPSQMEPEQALAKVVGLFSWAGYRWIEIDESSHSIQVSSDPLAIAALEPAVRFELHETKGCSCPSCIHAMEVAYDA